jgi:hypothetical protein
MSKRVEFFTVEHHDPRDDSEVRPQVGFRLRAGAYDAHSFSDTVRKRLPSYHDLMLFDASDGEVPGVVRFDWDTASAVVDTAAEWLQSLPYVLKVFPHHGGPIGAA